LHSEPLVVVPAVGVAAVGVDGGLATGLVVGAVGMDSITGVGPEAIPGVGAGVAEGGVGDEPDVETGLGEDPVMC